MTDIRLVEIKTLEAVTMDWLLKNTGTLDESEELATAVRVALGTDRLADEDDELPGFDGDRRGWWGDLDAEEIWDGWPIGTRLWLLSRTAIRDAGARQGSTLALAEDYTSEALHPFIEKAIASRMNVVATRTGINNIVVDVTLYRGPIAEIALRYQSLWLEG